MDNKKGPPKSVAQQRRILENKEFALLSRELPLARAITGQHIDKVDRRDECHYVATMVRLALSYIKLHNMLKFNAPRFDYDSLYTNEMLDVLDGFLMVVGVMGDIYYVSETISLYLGLSQVEMTGHQLMDYVHENDLAAFQEVYNRSTNDVWPVQINVRLKSSLTKRANKDTARASPGYKVLRVDINLCGRVRLLFCQPLPSLVLSTVTIPPHSFVISTHLDLTITYMDTRAEELLSSYYLPSAYIKGTSFYGYIHIEDVHTVRTMHYDAFNMRSHRSCLFRILQNQTSNSFYVQSTAYRYSSQTNKGEIDMITIVSTII